MFESESIIKKVESMITEDSTVLGYKEAENIAYESCNYESSGTKEEACSQYFFSDGSSLFFLADEQTILIDDGQNQDWSKSTKDF